MRRVENAPMLLFHPPSFDALCEVTEAGAGFRMSHFVADLCGRSQACSDGRDRNVADLAPIPQSLDDRE